MRPIVKKNSAVFYPQGFLDGLSAEVIIEPSDVGFVLTKKPKALFVSLKKVIFFNKKGLSILIEGLKSIQSKIYCDIGFCELDKKKYKTILSMFDGNLEFSLFENLKVMSLFYDEVQDSEEKILVYNDEVDQKNQIAIELYELGYKPYVAKDFNDFKEKEEEYRKYGVVVRYSYIANVGTRIDVHIKSNIVFYGLKGFIDSDVNKKFDLQYHSNLLRVGFRVFVFDISKVSSMNIHGVNFLAKLSTAGAEYGTTFCIVGIDDKRLSQQLRNDLEDSGILLYEKMEDFLKDEDIKKEALAPSKPDKSRKKLTKNVISNINIFIDTTVNIITMLSQKKCKKNSVKIDKLTFEKQKRFQVGIFGIYKEMNIIFALVFQEELLLKTCNIFLNENEDGSQIADAFAELLNIVESKIKTNIKLHKVDIEVTLPRVFESQEDVELFFDSKKGILVDLNFEGEDLKLFLSA